MAQTLRYADEILQSFSDNISGLISAVALRDSFISNVDGKGLLEATDNVTLPITSGVWTAINPLLTNAVHTETFWSVDGNNFMFPNHSAGTETVVPAGYSKFGQFMSILELTKPGGGADSYSVQFTKNGVGMGEPESVVFTSAGTDTITLLHPLLVDVSIPTDLYGVQIQGVDTSDDLTLGYFTMQVSDTILLEAPAP